MCDKCFEKKRTKARASRSKRKVTARNDTSAPSSSRAVVRDVRVTSVSVVQWAMGERWTVPLPNGALRENESVVLGPADRSAKIELGVTLSSGDSTQVSFSLFLDTKNSSIDQIRSVPIVHADKRVGTVDVSVGSIAQTTVKSASSAMILLAVKIVLVAPLWFVFVFLLATTYAPSQLNLFQWSYPATLSNALIVGNSMSYTIVAYGLASVLSLGILHQLRSVMVPEPMSKQSSPTYQMKILRLEDKGTTAGSTSGVAAASKEEQERGEENVIDVDKAFVAAAEHLKVNKTLRISNAQKADVYGLYKQATKGPNTTSKPSMFDVVGLAKWQGWMKYNALTKDQAKAAYVKLTQELSPSFRPPTTAVVRNTTSIVADASNSGSSDNPYASLSTTWAASARQAVDAVKAMCEFDSSKPYCEWQANGGNEDAQFFIGSGLSKGIAIKAVLPYVPIPPSGVVEVLKLDLSDPRKQRLTPDVQSEKPLKRLNKHTMIKYQENKKASFFLTARDIVTILHGRVLEDGTSIIFAAKSVETPLMPAGDPSKLIRMQVYGAGWIFERVNGAKGEGTKMTYVLHFDLMGSIPESIIKAGSAQNLSQIVRLKKILLDDSSQYCRVSTITNSIFEICPALAPEDEDEEKEEETNDDVATKEVASTMPPNIQTAVTTAVENIRSMASSTGSYCPWSSMSKTGDVEFFKGTVNTGHAIKGVLPFVPVRPSAIIHLLQLPQDDPRKLRLNPDTDISEVLERFDNRTLLKYQLNKSPSWTVTARDMVLVVHFRKFDNGDVVLAVKSVKTPLASSKSDTKFVRMNVISAGWLLEAVKGPKGAPGTRATYVNHFDVMGSIPSWVVEMGSTKNLAQVVTMKTLISEKMTEYEKIAPCSNSTYEIWPPLAPASAREDDAPSNRTVVDDKEKFDMDDEEEDATKGTPTKSPKKKDAAPMPSAPTRASYRHSTNRQNRTAPDSSVNDACCSVLGV